MKIKFNSLRKSYTHHITFDNNTTFNVGNVEPLFCKFLMPNSKVNLDFNQLVRLSPLVVPSFARLTVNNVCSFVKVSDVFPAYDAFLSQTPVNVQSRQYVPQSVPVITNTDLFINLVEHYSKVYYFDKDFKVLTSGPDNLSFESLRNLLYNDLKSFSGPSSPIDVRFYKPASTSKIAFFADKEIDAMDFVFAVDTKILSSTGSIDGTNYVGFRLNQFGRFFYSVLRGLGYSVDYLDHNPISVLPYLSFVKAYFDIYQPKRFLSWHSTVFYSSILYTYSEPDFVEFNSTNYINYTGNLLCDFAGQFNFCFFASLDEDFVSAAQVSLINNGLPAFGDKSDDDIEIREEHDNLPTSFNSNISSTTIQALSRLWSFVTRNSVVGQSVRDWFKVHLGSSVQDDMFDNSSYVDKSVTNIDITPVVSSADTLNESKGDVLGALGGAAYGTSQNSFKFETSKNFGFLIVLSSILPLSRLSTGSQYELYNCTFYNQPLPEFDGLSYEAIPRGAYIESNLIGRPSNKLLSSTTFGYYPNLSSFKTLHNIRSGSFALGSESTSFIPYCVDTIPFDGVDKRNVLFDYSPDGASTSWRYPWLKGSNFYSFNRFFYNDSSAIDNNFILEDPVSDNYMSQTSFTLQVTCALKPLSDSYSIDELRGDVLSVDKD